ncbi:hypothetical protein VNO77_36986 [Canavalia gladiata]|uniref:C3H1-type domain-containing protein n=1 Tax=Canavalia gladiata TaxID=3824 RepID=A0AAN9K9M6_CANGL
MTSVCADHKFQLQPSHQLLSLKKSLRDIDIPPRKLLIRRNAVTAAVHDGAGDMFSDENLLHKYLPHNDTMDSDDDSGDPYAADEFRMFEFKVRRCTRSRSHDWTDCPFAHPGEKARRRDPRRFHYSGTVCPEYRRGGGCSRGDACEFSHGVFECWLHPSRYRTEACKDGKNCKRKVCFFAHTPRQLRVLPPLNDTNKCNNITNNNNNNNNNSNNHKKHCCVFCHCCCSSSSTTCSPTSTLFGMSHFSPPLSPSSSSPCSSKFVGCETNNNLHGGVVRYNDVFSELMCSLEGLNLGEASPVSASSVPHNLSWFDNVSFNSHEDHQQFILSPTVTTSSASFSNNGKCSTTSKFLREENRVNVDDVIAPDLGWVNDLLM